MAFKPKKRGNIRKRQRDDAEDSPEAEGSAVVLKAKTEKKGAMYQSTAKFRVKEDLTYKSSRVMEKGAADDATRSFDVDTEHDRDARAVFERSRKIQNDIESEEARLLAAAEDGENPAAVAKVYRGQAGYKSYLKQPETFANAGGAAKGPMRSSGTARISCRFDYQPDLCKDYKETGFCGYGDACKFMHDRGDYKTGWQLERDWDEEQKAKKMAKMHAQLEGDDPDAGDVSSDEEELPFACFICRGEFKDPVVTKCSHYFCEMCALKNYAKSSRCFVCNEQTSGIFNQAKVLIAKLAEKKKAEEEAANRGSDDEDSIVFASGPKEEGFAQQSGWSFPGTNTSGL